MKVDFCMFALALAASVTTAQTGGRAPSSRSSNHVAPSKLTEEQRALHALNRLTFGPRPGDLERVMAAGVDDWVEQQLHPDEINNSAMEARLNPFRTLRMTTRDLVETFPTINLVRAVADGKTPLPTDPDKARDLRGASQHFPATAAAKPIGARRQGSRR